LPVHAVLQQVAGNVYYELTVFKYSMYGIGSKYYKYFSGQIQYKILILYYFIKTKYFFKISQNFQKEEKTFQNTMIIYDFVTLNKKNEDKQKDKDSDK